ncbi:MAG: hypothetical protein V7724_08815 [Sediminicola sp.]
MKTEMTKFSLILTIAFALFAASCSSDDDGPDPVDPPTCSDGIQNGDETGVDCGGTCDACEAPADTELNGDLTEDLTLDPSLTYQLTGRFSVESGATLTIPAGTKIVATADDGAETETYIVIQKGAKIDIQGTAAAPVNMTSNNEEPGDWGGLVILGDATTTAGVDAIAEVGGLIYGGNNDADDSGSINYLIINYAGAQIDAESQYNGLTLYAVGSETSISNVAMLNGTDDGVEFFGGTVNVENIYLENNEDDSVDWTEGWNGTVTNTYVLHTKEGFSTAIEADKVNNNPKFINFSAISTVGGIALQFKLESGATITGLSLSGYDTTIDMVNGGPLTNVIIEGETANPNLSYAGTPTVDIAMFAWVDTDTEVESTVLEGDITSDLTLNPDITYFLPGRFSVETGATLTIPAGTQIIANADRGAETETYIVIQKGAKIDIQGTETAPVIMTSTNETAGDWGGLVILGDATTTAGVDAIAEVGGLIYGGNNDADDSGSINYLIINYAGAQIDAESQYNGLTLYAVGSETSISNVAMLNGTDDGVEFFGGTVNVENIYLENNEDDAVDWTEGWNGTVTNTYVLHTKEGFSTAIEADKVNGNPQFINFTAISTVGGTALQFKLESGATITNLYLEGYDTNIDMANGGPLANVQIDGAAAVEDVEYNTGTQVDVTMFDWATGL